jgi:hypothetical protein
VAPGGDFWVARRATDRETIRLEIRAYSRSDEARRPCKKNGVHAHHLSLGSFTTIRPKVAMRDLGPAFARSTAHVSHPTEARVAAISRNDCAPSNVLSLGASIARDAPCCLAVFRERAEETGGIG